MRQASASYALAEEFLVIPYPFVDRDRESIEEEYLVLVENGIPVKEISDMVLDALNVLLVARAKTKDEKRYKKLTGQISDMLGRLLVLEELFYKK